MSGASMMTSDLTRAKAFGAHLREARLIGAELRGADLRDADMFGADLGHADLREARLEGADMRAQRLDLAKLSGASYDAATLWPEGFLPEAAGAFVHPRADIWVETRRAARRMRADAASRSAEEREFNAWESVLMDGVDGNDGLPAAG